MSEFYFDRESHSYWLGKTRMPSLSSILSPLDDFSSIHPSVLSSKAEFGTNIHETIRLYLDGTLNTGKLEEGNKIAIELFEKWRGDNLDIGDVVYYETPTYHQKLKYGTTPDLIYQEAIVEIKTRPMKLLRDAIQLVAQDKCLPDFPPRSYWVLFLDVKNNKYEFKRCEHRQAWSVFRKLLDRYNREREFVEFLNKWKEHCK